MFDNRIKCSCRPCPAATTTVLELTSVPYYKPIDYFCGGGSSSRTLKNTAKRGLPFLVKPLYW